MSNSIIQLPTDGVGKKLDTEQLTVGANTVQRERDQIAGVGADDIAVVTDTDPTPGTDHGLVVKILGPVNPVSNYRVSASLAADASVDLDAATIAVGATGKLKRVQVSSSVPCSWSIIKRDGAVETIIGVIRTGGYAGGSDGEYVPPDKYYDTLAYVGGDENFRVKVTNQWIVAADVNATIFWDEVT